MNTFLHPLCHAALRHLRKYKSSAEAFQREIDVLLKEASQQEILSWQKAFSYAKCVILFSLHRFEVHVAAVVVFVIVFGTGIFIPIGTSDFLTRLSLVVVATLIGTSLSFIVLFLLLPLHIRHKINLWLIMAVHGLACAVIFSILEPEIIRNFQNYSVPVFYSMPVFTEILIPVLLIFGIVDIFVIWHLIPHICTRKFQKKHQTAHIETLLPANIRGEILLMTAADHYVELFTAQGSHMHRITMKTAVERMPSGKGLQVHRSHWVAYKAMLSLEKVGERYVLTLRSGQQVPVSPKALPIVRCELDVDCLRAAE